MSPLTRILDTWSPISKWVRVWAVLVGGFEAVPKAPGSSPRKLADVWGSLVHGTEVVPAAGLVSGLLQAWPGIRPQGEVSEYQLVV
eukprot:950464-Amphidinium_carterae.1